MNKVVYLLFGFAVLLSSCTRKETPFSERPEDREAKQLLQGVWLDESTETAVFQIKGDTVFYADSTSMPAYFKVVEDSLYIGSTGRYRIEKHTNHVLWFKGQNSDLVKYVKSDDDSMDEVFEQTIPQIQTLTEVLKRDTVVFYNGTRYHLYVAVNPTKYKVSRHTVNSDGLDVENVYYDNIINLSVYKGDQRVFSRDFRKNLYNNKVPSQVLNQAILNDMTFDKADAKGLHFRASVCVPGDASCYMVGHTVSYDGQLTTQLLEY